jgi:hypothetical protein
MRWRTVDEVKTGKGERICANVSCGKTGDLAGMEVAFSYTEDGDRKNVLVKCVLCEKCGKKMRRAHGNDESKKRSRNRPHDEEGLEKERKQHHHDGHHGKKRHKHERTSRESRHDGTSDPERFLKSLESELASESPLKS